jgi:hypothetical protein
VLCVLAEAERDLAEGFATAFEDLTFLISVDIREFALLGFLSLWLVRTSFDWLFTRLFLTILLDALAVVLVLLLSVRLVFLTSVFTALFLVEAL